MYATYDYYLNAYDGDLSEADFARCARRASRQIDIATCDRAETAPESMAVHLQQCCCELTDQFHRLENLETTTDAGLLASASNDGVSENYGGYAAALKQCRDDIRSICLRWLSLPVNLMYRGCG
jgi:hypothetical protein